MSEDSSNIITRPDGTILKCIEPHMAYPNLDFDFSQCVSIPSNETLQLPTFEDRTKHITDRIDKMQKELESQTSELEHVRYENMKLNAQVKILNKNNEKQLDKIERLRNINYELKQSNSKLQGIINSSKWSNTKSLFVGITGTVIAEGIIALVYSFISNL